MVKLVFLAVLMAASIGSGAMCGRLLDYWRQRAAEDMRGAGA